MNVRCGGLEVDGITIQRRDAGTCGYHALKNAVIGVLAFLRRSETEEVGASDEFFQRRQANALWGPHSYQNRSCDWHAPLRISGPRSSIGKTYYLKKYVLDNSSAHSHLTRIFRAGGFVRKPRPGVVNTTRYGPK